MEKKTIAKLIFGGVCVGITAALAYQYIKKYKELAPKKIQEPDFIPEEGEEFVPEEKRTYSAIDMEVAKEAAVQTFESIKTGGRKAWGVVSDSAKAVSGIVMDNYGDSINAAKENAAEKFRNAKDFAAEKAGVIKEKAADTFDTVKETVTVKFNEVKDAVTEKVQALKTGEKEAREGACEASDSAEEAYENLKAKVEEVVSEASNDDPIDVTSAN